jgi:hypothetical protein
MQTYGPTPVADHNGEEGRSLEYLIPRKRRRLPPPSVAGNTIPYAATGTGGEATDEDPPSSNAAAGHTAHGRQKPPYTKRKRHRTPEADTSADAVARKLRRNKIFHGPANGGTIAPNSTVGRNQGILAIFILPPSKGRTRRHLIG